MERIKARKETDVLRASLTELYHAVIDIATNSHKTFEEKVELALNIDCKSLGSYGLFRPFNKAEVKKFGQLYALHQDDLKQISVNFGTRSIKELIEFYYKWKNIIKSNNISDNITVKSEKDSVYTESDNNSVLSENSESEKETNNSKRAKRNATRSPENCFNCRKLITKFNETNMPTVYVDVKDKSALLCKTCSVYWYKYGSFTNYSQLRATLALNKESKNNKTKKIAIAKSRDHSLTPTIKSEMSFEEFSRSNLQINKQHCIVCFSSKDESNMCSCFRCETSYHYECYGIDLKKEPKSRWKCDSCSSDKLQTFSKDKKCLICRCTHIKEVNMAIKPTTGNNWAHVICTEMFYIPFKYVLNHNCLQIEGISHVDETHWGTTCSICGLSEGLCTWCILCRVAMHPSCAHFEKEARIGAYVDNNNQFSSPSGERIVSICKMHKTEEVNKFYGNFNFIELKNSSCELRKVSNIHTRKYSTSTKITKTSLTLEKNYWSGPKKLPSIIITKNTTTAYNLKPIRPFLVSTVGLILLLIGGLSNPIILLVTVTMYLSASVVKFFVMLVIGLKNNNNSSPIRCWRNFKPKLIKI